LRADVRKRFNIFFPFLEQRFSEKRKSLKNIASQKLAITALAHIKAFGLFSFSWLFSTD